MWGKATFSYRRKRLVLATVALLVPTVVFCVIQYRSLTALESKTRLALAEQLRQDLIAARRQVWRGISNLVRVVLFPASDKFFTRQYLPWLKAHFAESRRLHPEIQELFLVSYPALQQGVTLAYLDGPAGQTQLDRTTWKQNRDATLAVSAYAKAQVLVTAAVRSPTATSRPNSRRGFLHWQDDCPTCADRPEEAAYIFYGLLDPQTNRDVGFVGMKLDLKTIKDSYLPQAIAAFQKSAADRGESNLSLAVFDASQHEIYATRPDLRTYEVRMSLGPVFSRWDVAAAYSGSTVARLARESLMRDLGLLVFAFSILLLGIFLILGAAHREMKLAEAKSAFVSNVSHELKTPLSLIRLFGETLESGRVASPEKAHEYYRIIHNESVRLSQLINNILDFAQIESGRKQYNFELADVNELVASVVETYRQQIIDEGFELGIHLQEGLPEIAVDHDAISQAVLNLLSNAVKYSTDTKKIMISVRQEHGSILIQVADLGIGIPKSEHTKIFEKFYRVGSELVHNTKGSGLGLSLVKHITEAHQGQIRVQSAPGKGSTFTLVLPIRQPESAPEKPKDLRYGLAQNLNR